MTKTKTLIPADFPRGVLAGAVPGVQPKLLARKQDDQFVSTLVEQDILARYLTCEDLAQQLVAYTARKRAESPRRSEVELRDKVAQAVRQKSFGWGLSPTETEWVIRRLDKLVVLNDVKNADDHENSNC